MRVVDGFLLLLLLLFYWSALLLRFIFYSRAGYDDVVYRLVFVLLVVIVDSHLPVEKKRGEKKT
jgi:hypothetical protein